MASLDSGGATYSEAFAVSAFSSPGSIGATIVGEVGSEAFSWKMEIGDHFISYFREGVLGFLPGTAYSAALGESADGFTIAGQSGDQAFSQTWFNDVQVNPMKPLGFLPGQTYS